MSTTMIMMALTKGRGGVIGTTTTSTTTSSTSSTTSSTTTSTTTSGAFNLLAYSGLQAYYEMTVPSNVTIVSGKANALSDISIHARTMNQPFPTLPYPPYVSTGGIAGGGYLSLDTTGGIQNTSTGISGAISMYAVVRFRSFDCTFIGGQGTLKTAIGFANRQNGLVVDVSATRGTCMPYFENSGGIVQENTYLSMQTTAWQIVNLDTTTGASKVRINNQPHALAYTHDLGGIGASQIWLGYYTLAANVDIAALIIVNGTVNTADENNIYAWIAARYPVTIPQFFEAYGDSITAGNEGDFNIWPWLVSADRGYQLVSQAMGGTIVFPNNGSTGVPGSNFVDRYQTSFTRPYAGQWVVFAFGTNDANQGGINATWKTTYQGYIQQFINFGYNPAKMVIVKAPTTSVRQSVMAQCFTYVDQIGAALGINVYDANARFLANGGDSLFADALHPTAAGQRVYADGIELIIT